MLRGSTLVRLGFAVWASILMTSPTQAAMRAMTSLDKVVPVLAEEALASLKIDPEPCTRGQCWLSPVTITAAQHPLSLWSTARIEAAVRDPSKLLGTASLGKPNRGRLLNGLRLPEDPMWVVASEHVWGTPATVDGVQRAVATVHRNHPDTQTLYIGDLSRERGGWLRPHRSHQSGRDADLGYYYTTGAGWYVQATRKNLDVARTWTLVRALLAEGSVEYIFIDRSIQELLKAHAEANHEDRDWLESIFESPRKRDTVIRHEWGHSTHFHVRFHDNEAERTGLLVEAAARKFRLL